MKGMVTCQEKTKQHYYQMPQNIVLEYQQMDEQNTSNWRNSIFDFECDSYTG